MNRTEFDSLDIEDKMNYLNNELEKGNTVTRVMEDLRIGEKTLQKIIKENGYSYNQKLRRYVKCNTNIIQSEKVSVDDKDNTFIIPQNFKTDMLEMISMKDDLKEIIKAFKEGYDKEHTQVIEVISEEGIKIELPTNSEIVRTTVRVNKEVLDMWNSFCDEHSEYSKTNLLSMSMLEYINRFK
ncbi:MAG: hypothetical protein ACRCW0_08980 [Clostridium sp.]